MTTKRQVCVAIDDSPHSERAMRWTLGKYVGANDHIELVTVTALPRLSVPEFTLAPLPARSHVPTNVVDQQVEENRNKATRAAIHLLEKYIKLAEACGVRIGKDRYHGYRARFKVDGTHSTEPSKRARSDSEGIMGGRHVCLLIST